MTGVFICQKIGYLFLTCKVFPDTLGSFGNMCLRAGLGHIAPALSAIPVKLQSIQPTRKCEMVQILRPILNRG